MARLYLDEDVPVEVADLLRSLGHDVETTDQIGRKGSDDVSQLTYAIAGGRSVITHNRRDFRRLHRRSPNHAGIILCTRDDADAAGLASRIHQAISAAGSLVNRVVHVYRPS